MSRRRRVVKILGSACRCGSATTLVVAIEEMKLTVHQQLYRVKVKPYKFKKVSTIHEGNTLHATSSTISVEPVPKTAQHRAASLTGASNALPTNHAYLQ